MEDIGINWAPPLRGAPMAPPRWQMSDTVMQYVAIFLVLGIVFCWCKNFKLSATKYMRGRDISI
jgi:hypothetical protein